MPPCGMEKERPNLPLTPRTLGGKRLGLAVRTVDIVVEVDLMLRKQLAEHGKRQLPVMAQPVPFVGPRLNEEAIVTKSFDRLPYCTPADAKLRTQFLSGDKHFPLGIQVFPYLFLRRHGCMLP